MKLIVFIFLITIALLVDNAHSEKHRKHKKYHNEQKPFDFEHVSSESEGSDDPYIMMKEDEEFALKEAEAKMKEHERENERARQIAAEEQRREAERREEEIRENTILSSDPCARVHCGAGRICQINDDLEAECVCIENCPTEEDPRRKVCSNHNETWGSDCAVYQHRCWCDKGDERCRGDRFKHVHIEYYGECREISDCTEEEMADFPRRMRDWLFNIMRDLADRRELNSYYLQLEREAETNLTVRWANAAIWKWCDLDGHPHDRSISRHELFPIRAPLVALEHCIGPFLDSCDPDNDHRITLKEWGKCLEINEDDLEDKCEELVDEE